MTKLVLALFCSLAALAAEGDQPQAVGGQWVRVEHKDPTTGILVTSFAVPGETIDVERHPSIVMTCDGDRDPVLLYHGDVKFGEQAHDVYNHYASSLWVYLKVNDGKPYRVLWEIARDENGVTNRALIDVKTQRTILSGDKIRVRFRDAEDEEHLDSFDLSGLSPASLEGYCQQKWVAKNQPADKSNHTSRRAE